MAKRIFEITRSRRYARQLGFAAAVISTAGVYLFAQPIVGSYALVAPAYLIAALGSRFLPISSRMLQQ